MDDYFMISRMICMILRMHVSTLKTIFTHDGILI